MIQLINAAERVGATPIHGTRLHALAYLADVLSPVWNLQPIEGKILKIAGGPHYPDLQRELDRLSVMGILLVSGLRYIARDGANVIVEAQYALNFASSHVSLLLSALGARADESAIDSRDSKVDAFLVDLAGALATLQDNQIEAAASVDATYSDDRVDFTNIVDFGSWTTDPLKDNLSVLTAERFRQFLPERARLSAGEKLYLYATFLGRRTIGG